MTGTDDGAATPEVNGDQEPTDAAGGIRRRHVLEGAVAGGALGVLGLAGHEAGVGRGTAATSGCDLAITKHQDCSFEHGEDATYTIQVCNVGDADCTQSVTVTDDLPDGLSYEVAEGTGWTTSVSNGTVTATHQNPTGIGPGTCLPAIDLEVSVAAEADWPDGQVTNCATVSTGDDGNADNDQACEDVCMDGSRTFTGGTADGFDTSDGTESTTRSTGLQAKLDAYGPSREFDEGGINAVFGHSFTNLFPDPNLGKICDASLEIRLRPEDSSLTPNDTLGLKFFESDGSPSGTGWKRFIGSGNGESGLLSVEWHPDNTGARTITLDLDALPLASGGTQSLLAAMNDEGLLDVHVQDDTAVDYATLKVTYCCDHEILGECDLVVDKRVDGGFAAGGTGTYTVDVCNVGDGDCADRVTVTDDLPAGLAFDSASGTGWSVSSSGGFGGTVTATHDGDLPPGKCLPSLSLSVAVADVADLPDGATIENCVDVSAGDDTDTANNTACATVDCLSGTLVETGGEQDGYASPTEAASPGSALAQHIDDHQGQRNEFDETTTNAGFGHTFTDLHRHDLLGEICGATLEVGLKPIGTGLVENDTITVGTYSSNRGRVRRYLGSGNGEPGHFGFAWNANNTSGEVLTLDIDDLEEGDGTTTSLLHVLQEEGKLDVFVQDDTAVDFARLTVQYCCTDEPTGQCDLTVQKSTASDFYFGQNAQYEIEVCNDGDGECVGQVEVVDDLPAGMTFSGSSGSGWSVSSSGGSGGTVTATHPGPVPAGDCLPPLSIDVDVASQSTFGSDPATVDNCVDLSLAGTGVDSQCLTHDVTSDPGQCDLAIHKQPDGQFNFGSAERYVVEVCNHGDGLCSEPITVVDELPQGVAPVGVTGTGWVANISGQLVEAHHPNSNGLAPGDCLTFVIDVQVAQATAFSNSPATVENCVRLEEPPGDPTGNNLHCVVHDIEP